LDASTAIIDDRAETDGFATRPEEQSAMEQIPVALASSFEQS
jgi:hypothetical protein